MPTRKEDILVEPEEQPETGETAGRADGDVIHSLVRTAKSIVFRKEEGLTLDPDYISPRFYNSFNFSPLSRSQTDSRFTLGITSARPGDGKTLVAANMAVSIAVAEECETVLVDLNLRHPKVHSVFGIPIGPGLNEALSDTTLMVARTAVRHLHILTAGNPAFLPAGIQYPRDPWLEQGKRPNGKSNGKHHGTLRTSAMTVLAGFRDILYSLQQRFEIVIIDMPCILDPMLPLHLTHQMHGLLLVVSATGTTRDDVIRVIQRVGKEPILGMVMNRIQEFL
jgi:Mrp family chromosome partitioning ATPase